MYKVTTGIFITCLLLANTLAADSDAFVAGDFMFISARIIGCDHRIRMLEFGEVEESGEVTIFENITFNVQDKTTSEVTEMLVDALEKRSGYRSQTIRIIRTPEEDAKARAMLLMQIVSDGRSGCMKSELPDFYEEWRPGYRLAKN